MTNREQVAWAFVFSDYDAEDLALIVCDMLDAARAADMTAGDRDRLAAWLRLECDPETNNWGVFPAEEDDA